MEIITAKYPKAEQALWPVNRTITCPNKRCGSVLRIHQADVDNKDVIVARDRHLGAPASASFRCPVCKRQVIVSEDDKPPTHAHSLVYRSPFSIETKENAILDRKYRRYDDGSHP